MTTERPSAGWRADSLRYLDQIDAVLDEMRAYWPLTLRQVYYRLVSDLVIDNNRGEYGKLSRILTKA